MRCIFIIFTLCALALGCSLADPARADSLSDAVNSIVAVLPDWPGGYQRQNSGLEEPEGSAVAVLSDGYLATNAHVLGRAKRIDIRLADGRLVAAKIIGRDQRTDIALLKAPINLPISETVPPPPLGERVCAVGNAFGLGISMTCGVVSAVNRSNAGFNPVEDFIQTDAAVNPGASGGALVDGKGRLVGLLSAIFTKKSDANIGVNFAVSSALLMRVVKDLRDHGRVQAGWAGWRLTQLNAEARRRQSGVRVVSVEAGGAAANAGLRIGDVVTQVAGRAVVLPSDAAAALYLHRPGDAVGVSLSRDGKSLEFKLRLRP
jgi:S1-C subfamily serine protease